MVKVIKEHRIAAVSTTSMREILKMFQANDTYQILRLKANASDSETMEPTIKDEDYGVKGYQDRKMDIFNLNYRLRFDDGRPENPIDSSGRKDILRYLDRLVIEDAPVDYLELLINDPELGKIVGNNEKKFQVTLTSDPCDGDDDEKLVKEHSLNENLIKYCGFKYRVLNCRKLIDRKQVLTKKKTRIKPQIRWEGKTVISLDSPIKLAQRLREHFEPYQMLKKFGADKEDTITLIEATR